MRAITSAVITGPTGVIGSALISELSQMGVTVYPVVRPGCKRLENIPESSRGNIIECDISQYTRLPEIVGSADAFFHLAWANARYGRDDMAVQTDNLRYSVEAAEAAAAMGCKVFIGAGSQAEYGVTESVLRPDTPCFPETGYGAAKHCAGIMTRRRCEYLGVEHIWIRVLSVYGECDGESSLISYVTDSLLSKKTPSLTPCGQLWDYIYGKDAAKAFIAAAFGGKDRSVYTLGSGEPKKLKEYVEILRDAIDPSLPLGFGEIPYPQGQVMHLCADISALQNDTGFSLSVPFEEGICRTVEYKKAMKLL